jgi:4-hydroxy-4-methyl-2-oxoglutarate aldolase
VQMAIAREAKEAAIIKRIESGERTLEVYNF